MGREVFLDFAALGDRPEPLNYRGYVGQARRIYPDDLHEAVATVLRQRLPPDSVVRTSVLDDAQAGLGAGLLEDTDVLVWWSHVKHHLVPDETVERIWYRVLGGMGLVMLHAGIESKIFRRLMGTTCNTGGWRQSDDWEAVWTASRGHPIARGVPPVFVIPTEEVYCEPFDIPEPDEPSRSAHRSRGWPAVRRAAYRSARKASGRSGLASWRARVAAAAS